MSEGTERGSRVEPLVLASGSPRREQILRGLGFEFRIVPSDVDESPPENATAEEIAEQLALRKARAVAATVGRGTVIGADTIVVLGDRELLGKPADAAVARATLAKLSGTTHRVITGVALVHVAEGIEVFDSTTTRVTMRSMNEGEIAAYVESGEAFGKAGAYAIQEHGDRFVVEVDGPYDNVVGFPSAAFRALLARMDGELALRGGA